MTRHEFDALFHEWSHERLVRPSEAIEGAIEVQSHGALVCVEWNGEARRLETTVPLPELLAQGDPDDALRLRLYRALLAWQWAEPTGAHRLGFGLIEDREQVVGMASIATEAIHDTAALGAALADTHDALLNAWLELGTRVLAEGLVALQDQVQPDPAPWLRRI